MPSLLLPTFLISEVETSAKQEIKHMPEKSKGKHSVLEYHYTALTQSTKAAGVYYRTLKYSPL